MPKKALKYASRAYVLETGKVVMSGQADGGVPPTPTSGAPIWGAKGHHAPVPDRTIDVTPKTVEVHLTNVYRKLGIRTRHELGAELTNP